MKLYKLVTSRCNFYIVASDPTAAENMLDDFLRKNDYDNNKFKLLNIIIVAGENKYIRSRENEEILLIGNREKIE